MPTATLWSRGASLARMIGTPGYGISVFTAWSPQRIYEFAGGQLVIGAHYPGVGYIKLQNLDAREALAVAPFDHARVTGLIRFKTGESYDGRGSIEAGTLIEIAQHWR